MCVESTSILDHNDANVRYRAASALIDSEAGRQRIWTVSPDRLLVGLKKASRNRCFSQQANATALRQWRSWLRGRLEAPNLWVMRSHLSMRVGLYLHPRGMVAIQSLRLPLVLGAWFDIALSLARRRFHRL